ncbi:pullulanase-type alpha-1,6-glucosidase [Halomonas sp. BM-2019]|uniref:pullulanase-type alpha-1,6-glucosidase n=1 Tax=Halomonas sp. BM-2019 TaxID=2811227 RepID=UPI001B3C3598|nr:MAG: pullulanase-type alpha-1,6-glucosidase [Halomonas sp. BM-2019]
MNRQGNLRPLYRALYGIVLTTGLPLTGASTLALAAHTVDPDTVTLVGSLQSELGCAGDWQPECVATTLSSDASDGVWQGSFDLPAGNWEYKVVLNGDWNDNYGADGEADGSNIALNLAQPTTVTFVYDPATHEITNDDLVSVGNLGLARAHWLAEDTIAWEAPVDAAVTLHHDADANLTLGQDGVSGGQELSLTHDPAGLEPVLATQYPHLAGLPVFRIDPAALPRVPSLLKGQIAVSATDGDGNLLDATALQIPGVLDDLFPYGGELGVSFDDGIPTLRLWAPTAQSVTLQLFTDADPATTATALPMTQDPATGVWSITGDASWDRQYYLYEVEVFARSTGRVERNRVTDPYSHGLAANSSRSHIVNLDDADLQPEGWETLAKPDLATPNDIVIYELHVRDFSIGDPTVAEPLRGTYRAFTETDSAGMQHLQALAQVGLTHIHLLPTNDCASIPERRAEQQEPEGDLAQFPSDSAVQQKRVAAVQDQDGFNWCYDPFHYTVPEGSYATAPDSETRIREFREMVRALNDANLNVVIDVVYNHTPAAGQAQKSVLDQIVPGYYQRLDADGAVETSSCCPNTASEHAMMEKLMVDSLVTWAKDYKVDGFRFDLMGHHMKDHLLRARDTLRALTPAADGVDGERIYLYGEGWNFGEVADNARGVNATQLNMAGTGIGTFNDRIRDAIRGGGPFDDATGVVEHQGFINGLFYDPNEVNSGSPDERDALLLAADQLRVGLAGNLADYPFVDRNGDRVTGSEVDYNGAPAGYTAAPQEAINYAASHDNETLFDINQFKAPRATSMADRVRIQNMGNSFIALGQGIPFFHAGQDMLRSKSLDRNSYNSGDWFNVLDFSYRDNGWGRGLPREEYNGDKWTVMAPLLADPALKPERPSILATVRHFREVLEIRQSSPLFRLPTAAAVEEHLSFLNTGPSQIPGLIAMRLSDPTGAVDPAVQELVVLFNANDQAVEFNAPEFQGQRFRLHPVLADSADPLVRNATFAAATGTFAVPGRTTAVFRLLASEEH